MAKRTDIDFSKHKYERLNLNDVTGSCPATICSLHLDSEYHKVVLITANGITSVTGDFGNWVFNREFVPDSRCSDFPGAYWASKLSSYSGQSGYVYDGDKTEERIKYLLSKEGQEEFGREWAEDEKEYLENCFRYTDSEQEYVNAAFHTRTGWFARDSDHVPYEERLNPWLEAIFDAIEEMCRRES